MKRHRRVGISLIAVLMLALGVFAANGTAATKTITIKCSGKLASQTEIEGSCTGSLGKGTFKTVSSPPSFVQVMKFAGGSLTLKGQFTPSSKGTFAGTWKISKATGSLKGSTGGGKIVASGGTSTLTGTIKS